MHRDLCLCLTCLSKLSQPEHREILTTSCQSCGKTLIARAHPGYQYCVTCSTNENCCMSWGSTVHSVGAISPSVDSKIIRDRTYVEVVV